MKINRISNIINAYTGGHFRRLLGLIPEMEELGSFMLMFLCN